MKYLPVALAVLAALRGFKAARLWKMASDAGNADYAALGTEPATFQGSTGYRLLAT
jgi:hypothetical protein